jgi:ABC-2 type transport system ATP-binding protein
MIELNNVSFGYRSGKLLYKGLTMNLEEGRIYGLLGRNGAGKSTLLKNMSGMLFPVSGKITVNGHEPRKREPVFLHTIYFIPEEVFVPSITIARYVSLFAPFYPNFNIDQLKKYLTDLEVDTADKLTTLSFGQQKKFIIAFGLACNTAVLLLDEPTNGLDIPSKKQFRKLIAGVMDSERTIIISTHQIRDIDNLIDQVIIVDDGKLLLNAPVSEVGEKLLFKTVQLYAETSGSLYFEETIKGISVVVSNAEKQQSKVDLEHLFNAVTENPERIKAIF